MWFRNLRFFRLTQPFDLDSASLSERLSAHAFRRCGEHEPSTMGWEPPYPGTESLVHTAGGCLLMALRNEERVLPPAVIRERVEEEAAALESETGRRPGRQARARLRERLTFELLPQAFTRSHRTWVCIDRRRGLLAVDSSGARRAEDAVSLLRESLGTLPAVPPATREAPERVLTAWLRGTSPPGDLVPGRECELRQAAEDGGVIRCRGVDPDTGALATHLADGWQVARLALEWEERLSFVLCSDLSLRRLRPMDLLQSELEDANGDDLAGFDASAAITCGEIGRLAQRLLGVFGAAAD
ncbi:MAG TPA: recombination-associated protein RdgC [Gammaproteobacteria bacterium]|nr:recombination-associated protein RdgC [Gammaproteobacteria bacterium]